MLRPTSLLIRRPLCFGTVPALLAASILSSAGPASAQTTAPILNDSINRSLPTPNGSTGADWLSGTMLFPSAGSPDAVDWITGVNVNAGGILFPHMHTWGVFGGSTTDPASLASGHHDPQANATLQALEPALSLRAGMLQGFATAVGVTDSEGEFEFFLEEGFLKLIDLPFGTQLRGGQYFNRFGFQNSVHNHGWMFVDQNLVNGRFLNEGELITQGGELTWNVPLDFMRVSSISTSVGGMRTHAHNHDHGHGHEGHDHGESPFEGEGAAFQDLLVSTTWVNQYDFDDRNRLTGILSGAWGDNAFGRQTQVYGLGVEYLWRENGYAMGGHSVRWRTEMMIRGIDAVSGHLPGEHEDEHGHDEEHGHEDDHEEDEDHDEDHDDHDDEDRIARSFNDFGINTMLIFGFNDRLETGLRAEWVSGLDELGLDNRWRLSPMITWYANPQRTLQTRLQYNCDFSNDFGTEHSIWFQVGTNWGGAEVR
jgi:hypothetical protein